MPDPAPVTPPRGWGPLVLVLAGVALLAFGAWWLFLRPETERTRGFGDYTFDDPARIYMGRATFARSPAVVDSSRVYAAIPEYLQIVREGLTDTVPQYTFLMKKASDRFKQAVSAVAKAAHHDVVAERGTVRVMKPSAPQPPDLTEDVLRSLR